MNAAYFVLTLRREVVAVGREPRRVVAAVEVPVDQPRVGTPPGARGKSLVLDLSGTSAGS